MKILLTILVAVNLSLSAAMVQETERPEAWSEEFLDIVLKDDASAAVRFLIDQSWIGQQRPFAMGAVKESLDAMYRTYGPAKEYELIREEKLGGALLALSYLMKHETSPVGWDFYFYKVSSQWNLIYLGFTDNVQNKFRHPTLRERQF